MATEGGLPMYKALTKGQILVLTVPNLLSVMRMLMIPAIVWLYCGMGNYGAAAAVIIISGIADIVYGVFARRGCVVSGFGKMLDFAADKLTLTAVMVCLAFRHRLMIVLIVLFAVKEACMLFGNLKNFLEIGFFRNFGQHGKRDTALYITLLLLVLFPGMNVYLANGLIGINGIWMLLSFISYMWFYVRL